mgnify:CR=1 FL=1
MNRAWGEELNRLMPNGDLEPKLATEWDSSADARVWTFRIRKGVQFHNGKELTPDDVIAALPHKTLVVHGRDDQIIPLENAFTLLRLLQDVQLHVFGRCGHWTQIEHATAFNRLVVGFLTT